jgi:predicted RNA methylase
MNKMREKELDQWYTNQDVADWCVNKANELGVFKDNTLIIEPSAGTGAFVSSIKRIVGSNILAYDIDPKQDWIFKSDWFSVNITTNKENTVVIGNPPYGKKGKLAGQFINHSFSMADTVAFIVPKTLSTSWTAQKNIDSRAKLVYEEELPEKAFIFMDKEVSVPSVFQVWKIGSDGNRLDKPETEHIDLDIRIYNKMPTAKKWLTWNWDIAVKRNSKKGEFIERGEVAGEDTHWILIKGPLDYLRKIDWSKLNDNKMTAGIGKADVIKAFKEAIK